MSDADLRVVAGDSNYDVRPGESFTFGRAESCTLRIAPDDSSVSRLAGEIERDGSVWFLANRSGSRPLAVVDRFGLRSVLAPGSRAAIEGRVRVVLDGARSHELVLHGPEPAAQPDVAAVTGQPTSAGEGVLVNEQDRLALVALFAGYLQEGDRYDPNPKSYAAAAARLGWPRTTLVKRIEYLRSRLVRAGVPNMQGWNALSALAEYALTTGLITKEDLRLIHR
ncbi:hypothetical protein [Phytohabitans houttuyneae]|uniref:FHA domain-containing protein n=1 Tax=Phytohabitans houttuyneae TaxID=1076126 RepID=A0A6V8KHB4_9ACTN|nr:hypothetical protein [Phytohabitans houttuyneae]GFJ81087.1 hypothetical protein Phou_052670 [Phytohabitans houttuyneae]